jgi:hypothetical protein
MKTKHLKFLAERMISNICRVTRNQDRAGRASRRRERRAVESYSLIPHKSASLV